MRHSMVNFSMAFEPFEPGCDVHPPLIGSPRAFRLNSTRGGRRDLGSSSLAIIGIARNIGRGKIESARRGFQSLGNSVFGGSYQVRFYIFIFFIFVDRVPLLARLRLLRAANVGL